MGGLVGKGNRSARLQAHGGVVQVAPDVLTSPRFEQRAVGHVATPEIYDSVAGLEREAGGELVFDLPT